MWPHSPIRVLVTSFLSAALSTPQLYCSTVDMDDVQYEARVQWIVNDTDTYNDVEYVVSVVNSSSPTPMDITTNQTHVTINLFYGVNYTIAVTAQRCGGNVSSEPSEACLYISGNVFNMAWQKPFCQKMLFLQINLLLLHQIQEVISIKDSY